MLKRLKILKSIFHYLLAEQNSNAEKPVIFFEKIGQSPFWRQFLHESGLYSYIAYHLWKKYQYTNHYFSDYHNSFFTNTQKNFIYNEIIKQISSVFERNKIQFSLLKGKLFAEAYYCHPGCRPMGDIDLFVFPEQKDTAKNILLDYGWKLNAEHIERGDHYTFFKGNAAVEIHWSIYFRSGSFSIFDIPISILREHQTQTLIDQTYFNSFSHELNYLHACLNYMKKYNGWPPVRYLDLYFITKKINFAKLYLLAYHLKMEKIVFFFQKEINYYFFSKSQAPSCHFPVIKNFEPVKRFYFIKLFYFFSRYKTDLIYKIVRTLIPDKKYLKNYFQSTHNLYFQWWKHKIAAYLNKSSPK